QTTPTSNRLRTNLSQVRWKACSAARSRTFSTGASRVNRFAPSRPMAGSVRRVALDVHPRVAMQILRHSQIAMTMEIYSEVPTAQTRSALKRLGRHLDG